MRVWVSGASGFTGQELVKALQLRGDAVIASAVDCRDADAIRDEIHTAEPEGIVHLAAISSPMHRPVSDFYSVNVVGTDAVLAAATEVSCLQRIVLASSATVYGEAAQQHLRLSEALHPEPLGHYALSKYAMERLVRSYPDLPIVVVRPFNYTGLGQSSDFLLAKVASHLRAGVRTIELGNLDLERDFTSVSDIIHAYVLCLNMSSVHNGVVNFCSGEPQNLRSLVEMMIAESGIDAQIVSATHLRRGREVASLAGDAARLRAWIGFVPAPLGRITLRQMVTPGYTVN
jgi:GDP-6-deoxy-D-talose 4-dehydrogenase